MKKKNKILIVEDTAGILLNLRERFQMEGSFFLIGYGALGFLFLASY